MKAYNQKSRKYNHSNRNNYKKNHKKRRFGPPKNLNSYERSVWLLRSFKGREVHLRDGESVDQLMRRFKRVVEHSGVMRELKSREYHLSKAQKKNEKRKRALKRLRKIEKRMSFYADEDQAPSFIPEDFYGMFGENK